MSWITHASPLGSEFGLTKSTHLLAPKVKVKFLGIRFSELSFSRRGVLLPAFRVSLKKKSIPDFLNPEATVAAMALALTCWGVFRAFSQIWVWTQVLRSVKQRSTLVFLFGALSPGGARMLGSGYFLVHSLSTISLLPTHMFATCCSTLACFSDRGRPTSEQLFSGPLGKDACSWRSRLSSASHSSACLDVHTPSILSSNS